MSTSEKGLSGGGSRLVILAPLRFEAFAARRGAPGATVERIGMGPGRATAARARLDRALETGRPVVLLGLGGGLVPEVRPGHVVVASALGTTNGAERLALRGSDQVADLLERCGLTVHLAPVVSSPAILHGAKARHEVAASGFAAVDMESYWCEPLARSRPFAVVRVALDVAGRTVGSTAMLTAGPRAYRSLVTAARALTRWSPQDLDRSSLLEVGER